MYYLEWIDDLRIRGKLSLAVRQDLASMFRSDIPSVRGQAIAFRNRMQQEHPDLWIAYQAKRRILGLSNSNPSHIHQHL
jgi:hypothetical protein